MARGPRYHQTRWAKAEKIQRARRRRREAELAFYSSAAWRELRELVLAAEPICRACGVAWAREVDHILRRRERPDLALERSNLQPLCRSCHAQKTRRGE